jgi:FlaA1/EpsC-like NDP-sugar epimerase
MDGPSSLGHDGGLADFAHDASTVLDGRMARFHALVRRRLPIVQFLLDAAAWFVAIPLATYARYDFDLSPVNARGVAWIALVAIVLQGAVGWLLGLYRRQYHYGSLEEVRTLGLSMAAVALLSLAVVRAFPGTVPRSVPILGGCLAVVIGCVVRYVARLFEEHSLRPPPERSVPIVVLGAGNAGSQIVRTMRRAPDSPYRPVALLDDDRHKARLHVEGLRVVGTRADVARVASEHGASHVLIAIPSASGAMLREISTPLLEGGLQVLVLPPVAELLGSVHLSDIRPITIADLLGRHPAEIDNASIAGYVRGRRVLVTGAGGSIGSELCRQLHAYSPAVVVMLDRDESGLHATQLSIEGRAMLDSPTLALADIRDRDRIFQVFQQHQPEVVFHAAALKHQPLLELHPTEAWKTNVVGTHHVLEAARAVAVGRFVNISTDKAADPGGVLGYTKRLCERLTADAAVATGRPFVSVRFGNVLGSKGSMLGTFERQVASGGPITVTDPEVSRYFMTVEEAIALTIQAGALGEPGEVLVLDMGRPVRILDVARRLAEQAHPNVDIVFTGLRPGEKLHEVLLGTGEDDVRPKHPLISHVPVLPLDFATARQACSVDGRLVVTDISLAAAVWHGLRLGTDVDLEVGSDTDHSKQAP